MSHRQTSASCEVCPRLQRTKINTVHLKSAVKKTDAPHSVRSMSLPSNRKNSPSKQLSKSPKQGSLIHRELFSDNGLNEVHVKQQKSLQQKHAGNPNVSKQTWGKVLKQQSQNENAFRPNAFNAFDPLNTIHFLAKELQQKVQKVLPCDPSVNQMVNEMQRALTRLPPDLSTKTTLIDSFNIHDLKPTRLVNSPQQLSESETTSNVKPKVINGSSQTPRNVFLEPEKLQKHIEESSEKIECVCRQMEALCIKLKADNQHLETLLSVEKEKVKGLNKQLEEQKNEFNGVSALVHHLQTNNTELEKQVTNLQEQLEKANQLGPSKELNEFIKEVQQQKAACEEECLSLNQKITLLDMEKKKLKTILQARDDQVREIRTEMSQLQDVVASQLMALRNSHNASSETSVILNTGHEKENEQKESGAKNSMVPNDELLISGDHEEKHREPRTGYLLESSNLLYDLQTTLNSDMMYLKKNQNELDGLSSTSNDSSTIDKNICNKFAEVKNKALASIKLRNK